jgi:hypothetical protein
MASWQIMQTAHAAARHGFAVFPTGAKKWPAIKSAHPKGDPARGRCRGECGQLGHGVYDATSDHERLDELFLAAPWATGYGVACGVAPHHLIGIDLDRKNGDDGVAEFEQLAARLGFTVPVTFTVLTPSNGLHLWLSAPGEVAVANSVRKLAPGIDIRSAGGYLVGPGSWTQSGRYDAEAFGITVAGVPAPLLELLLTRPQHDAATRTTSAVTGSARINGLLTTVLAAREGQRNSTLYWAACRAAEAVREGSIGTADARDLLLDAATDPSVGLDFGEAERTVASAFGSAGVSR